MIYILEEIKDKRLRPSLLDIYEIKIKLRSFKISEHINEKEIVHTTVSAIKASSVTLPILQHGAKMNNCNLALQLDVPYN